MAINGPSLQGDALNPLPFPAQTPPPDTPTPSFSAPIHSLGSPVRHASISNPSSSRDLTIRIHPTLQAEICTSSSGELVSLDGHESSVISSSDDSSNQNIISVAEATSLNQKIEEIDLYITDNRKHDQRYRTLRKRLKDQFLKMGLYTGCYGILYIRRYSIFCLLLTL